MNPRCVGVNLLDILPKQANLFGLVYDSGLLMGRDRLADTGHLVIFANRKLAEQPLFRLFQRDIETVSH